MRRLCLVAVLLLAASSFDESSNARPNDAVEGGMNMLCAWPLAWSLWWQALTGFEVDLGPLLNHPMCW